MRSTPTVEMLWESTDPHQALASRFKFADVGQAAAWVTNAVADTWGVEVIECDRVVISAGNALMWITTATGRMIIKWSARPSLFTRLTNVALLTSWLDRRGLPVSAPLPALNGDLQVELNGFSIGLQSVVEGSMLDADDPAQVHAAGAVLARLHRALADYPQADLGPGGQADSTPLRTRVEGWLHAAAGDHVAPCRSPESDYAPTGDPRSACSSGESRASFARWSDDQPSAGCRCSLTLATRSGPGNNLVMDQPTWPHDWDERRRGRGCPKCIHGRAEEDESGGVRFFAGRFADGYLQQRGPQAGYTIVAFHRRHVADLTEFTETESTGFWHDVVRVAGALNEVFRPCHMNYNVLGNGVPHVHAHVFPVTSTTRVQACPSRLGWLGRSTGRSSLASWTCSGA